LQELCSIGVDEVACLIDFGLNSERVLESLRLLYRVKEIAAARSRSSNGSVVSLINRLGVTHLQCTPSAARILLSDPETRTALGHLQYLLVGGEAFPAELAADLAGVMGGRVLNMYGPTETTIWSASGPVVGSPRYVPVGTPLTNQRVYVLDDRQHPAPLGVTGELYIAGDGVARGYLNQPGLTGERFVDDPFSAGGRMYRTGDLARWLPSGTIEVLGRLDQQVKIRGYRIEPAEIEQQFRTVAGIRDCVVVAREDTPGDKRLVAYLVPEGSRTPSSATLLQKAERVLPQYMVPSAVVFIDHLPLTPNSKVDRNALPHLNELKEETQERLAPSSGREEAIASIWREVLKQPVVGITDNFFSVGGNSLSIVEVNRRIASELGVHLSLADMFRLPTIQALAAFLDAAGGESVRLEAADARAEARRLALQRIRGRAGVNRRE
jgi:acyl-CoA synthetase (AMP-forming)/AMP-acid ligase II